MANPDTTHPAPQGSAAVRPERRARSDLLPPAPPDSARRPAPADSSRLTRQECGECLGAVAHRLTQALTALRGSLELALWSELNAQDSRTQLEKAFQLTDLVVNLVKSIRELAEAARAEAPPKTLSLRNLVKETWQELQGLADSRGIQTILAASLEAPVTAPPDRLREVVAKLLWLITQRSPDQGVIWLSVSAGDGSVCFLLADQGPSPGPSELGLASGGTASLGRLFAEGAKNQCLDWSILKVQAESLGGSLQVMPRHPQGCCFLLQLPLANPQDH